MKRIVITGGAGFIGSNLVPYLDASGLYEIYVIDNESLGRLKYIKGRGVTCIKGDILDARLMGDVLDGADTLVHLAADTRVMDSIANPDFNFRINVEGTYTLLRQAQRAGVRRVINASTGGAILGEIPPPVHEDMAPKPLSPYGASKLAVEGYCSAFSECYGLSTVSLRFSNIFGPRSFHKGSVIAHFFKNILNSNELIVFGDGSQVRDFLYVDDLVNGLAKFIESDIIGVFQLGSGRPVTINELLSNMTEIVGADYKFKVHYVDFRPGEIRETWSNIEKAQRVINFRPETTLTDGLRQTWRWFQKKG